MTGTHPSPTPATLHPDLTSSSDPVNFKAGQELQEKEGFGDLSLRNSQTLGGRMPEEWQSQNQSRKEVEESSHFDFHN